MLEREAVCRMIYETSQACADGYRRNISDINTDEQNRTAEQCAIAASNTGYFTLHSLGFSPEEIRGMRTPGQST